MRIIPDDEDSTFTKAWMQVKCEDSNVTVDRWVNQVMKIE